MKPEQLWIVLGWLLLTGAGICLTSYMIFVSYGDLQNLHKAKINGGLEALSKLALWQEARRFVIKVTLFSLGIGALFQPPEEQTHQGIYSWAFVVVLYGLVALLDYSTIAAIRYRRKYIRSISVRASRAGS